jgi:hypothetical protein
MRIRDKLLQSFALAIFGIAVTVKGQPIRASRQSAEWCLRALDQCWSYSF